MSIFSTILTKLGFNTEANAQPLAQTQAQTQTQTPPEPAAAAAQTQPAPSAAAKIDVVAQLQTMAASHAEKLNWKVSIVDLMKLLGLDSSLAARKELASELGCPADKMADSAQMNMWLHKIVLKKLAENGGNIPPELL
jgi:hypothetical protein